MSPRLPALFLAFTLGSASMPAQSDKPDAFGGALAGREPKPSAAPAKQTKKAPRKPASAREEAGLPFDGANGPASGTVRDGSGAISESVTTGTDGRSSTRRDARGRIQGTSSTTPDGSSTTYRDSSGRITGNVATNPSGDRSTGRDSSGRIQFTTSTSGNTTTYRAANGAIIGTREITPAGNVIYRKANGAICGPNFK